MLTLRYIVRGRFILRNNRKVAGEWGVYQADALTSDCCLWDLSYEQWDDLMDWTKRMATVHKDYTNPAAVLLCGTLPKGVTLYAIGRAIDELDG